MKHKLGFTLFEIVFTLAIIGILAAIAYPSYVSYILKSNRPEARGALTQTQILLEHCFAQHSSYQKDCEVLANFPHYTPQKNYEIQLSNLSDSRYTLTAIPIGKQTKDTTCVRITVNEANVKTALDNSGVTQMSCWS